MAVVTIRQLLDSGVHFGHQTRRWNPKVKRFILTERSGIHIIDLQQSLAYIDKAYEFVKDTVAHGGTILFVGTKKQAQEAVAEQAQRVGQPYVNQRWLGGLLTNFQTVHKRLNRLKELDLVDFDDTTKGYTKKELLIQRRERDKLEKSLGGIRNLARTPSAIWVVDSKREHLAVDEAKKLGIPIIGILDTNADPDELQYPIPGNDDAIRSVALLTRIIADAAAEGLVQRHQKPEDGQEAAEPLAEWELEVLHVPTEETPAAVPDEVAAATTAPEPGSSEPPASEPVAEEPNEEEPNADEPTADEQPTADVEPAPLPVEENDPDAQAEAHFAAIADESIVPQHAPETAAAVEAREEAAATPEEKKPAGKAPAKPKAAPTA